MHPGRDQLEAFAAGRLAAAAAEAIETHLLECGECGRVLDEIDLAQDHLIEFLRSGLAGGRGDTADSESAAPFAKAANQDLLSGDFGRYYVDGVLGRGGMGVVYRAYDSVLRRNVALKIIAPHRLAQSENRRRFRHEAESAARLQHANIVQVFDFGEHEGRMYCAMELVDGESLDQRLQCGPLRPEDAAKTTATLAEAVEYAHQRQIVHRDLKPANILFTSDDTPKIADFGLAKRLDDDVLNTADGTLLGSPCYMSPEQAHGDLKNVGPATDVHALGVLLYEMLVGQPPFHAPDVFAILQQVKQAAPVSPRRLRPSLDPDLECICLKCLEKDPKDRYGNAASLATDLRRYCDGMPIVARKIGWIRRTAKLARRHPVVSAQLALIAFVAIAFVATVVSYNVRLERTLKKETRAAYAMELQLAASVAPDNPGEALELLEHDRFESLHDFCWRHLLQSCKRGIHDWDNQNAVFAIAASPDSKTFATGDQRGTVRVWSIDDRQPRRVFGNAHAGKITDMAFSPDGQCLATSSEDCTTKLWTWPDLHPVLTLQGETSFNGLAFSPDGERLAAAGACSPEEAVSDGKAALGGTIHVWKMPSGEQEVVLPAHKESVFRVSFSSDGKHLASVSPEGLLCLWDVGSWNHTEHPGFGVAAAFHPKESARLAVSDMYQKVRVERITADERLDAGSPVCSSPATVSSLAFSPKGDYLAAGSYDGTTYVWNEASGAVMRLAMKESRVTAVGFLGPDRLVTGSHEGRIQCWDLRNCSRPDQWQAHPGRAIDGLIVLPGGRLVTSGADGFICLWDLRNGNCLQRCQRSGTSAVGVAGAANQKLLVWDDGGVIHRGFFDKDHRLVQERALSEPTFPRGLTPLRTGDRVVVADFDGLHVLGVDGHQTTLECEEEAICLAASPTEDLLAVAGQNGGVWLDRLDGKRRRLLASPGAAVRCMAFSAAGSQLAIGMNDGGVLFHDVASGGCTMTLRGHSEAINAIAFSADGRTVATGGANGNVRLWDPVGGEERMLLRGSSSIQNLCFSPEGTALVAGAVDGHVRVWNAVD